MLTLPRQFVLYALAFAIATLFSVVDVASAQGVAFKQAVAEAAARDKEISAFYKSIGYGAIWTGKDRKSKARRKEFLRAVESAGDHGLPSGRYDPEVIETNMRRVRSERELGLLEVEMSRLFLIYARDVQSGITNPRRIDDDIKRRAPLRDRTAILASFAQSTPRAFLRSLPPKSDRYARLMKEKLRFETIVAKGGWGAPVRAKRLELGDSGDAVVALRNRLIRMGFLKRSAKAVYDDTMFKAVQQFQVNHGLNPDGVAGPGTLGEINQTAATRLSQIMVAMERERWINVPQGLGERYIWVNLPDFRARVYDGGRLTFETKAVVGEQLKEKRTPEFSDKMEYMEVNPDWTVPRSIIGRDYLDKLQADPFAVSYLQMYDEAGRRVPREMIDFNQYTEETFPFRAVQAPGRENALGTVKFMFPNPHAIYLHDTPQRHLFSREKRTYSSGCIRLHDPYDFAYLLLKRQMSNPKPFFDQIVRSGRQTVVDLEQHVPVHIVYRTAFTQPKGRIQFRRDMYGRDAKVFRAMENAGVALRGVQG